MYLSTLKWVDVRPTKMMLYTKMQNRKRYLEGKCSVFLFQLNVDLGLIPKSEVGNVTEVGIFFRN